MPICTRLRSLLRASQTGIVSTQPTARAGQTSRESRMSRSALRLRCNYPDD